MGDLSRDDVGRAVRDAMHDLRNEILRIRDGVNRIDQRTNDLDDSQREIRDLTRSMQHVMPELDQLIRSAGQTPIGTQEMVRIRTDVDDIRFRMQNVERWVQQIITYLQAREKAERDGYGFRGNE